MNFKQYTIALLIILFCAGSVIVGIRSALTSETSDYTSLPDKEQGFTEYQGSLYSTVYYSAPVQGSAVAVPMRSVNSGILRHSSASYHAGAHTANAMSGTYASQGLTQTSYQVHSYGGASAGGVGGYVVGGGSTNHAAGSNMGYAGNMGLRTTMSPVAGYTGGIVASGSVGKQVTFTPMLAQVTWLDEYTPSTSGRKRIIRADGTADAGDTKVENGQIYVWDEDAEAWVLRDSAPSVGDKFTTTDGTVYVWNGSMWIPERDIKDPDTPVGDTPWLFFGLLVAGYVGIITYRRNKPKPCDKQ